MSREQSTFVPIVQLTLGVQSDGQLHATMNINPAAEGLISAESIARNLRQIADQLDGGQFVSMAELAPDKEAQR